MTTPILDLAALTAPIPGEQPAGVRLPADAKKKMEDARKEFEPNPDDPSKPPNPKKPDWPAIIKVASDSLTKTSKDLLAAARLTEAVTKRDGFAGLREGLQLLHLLVTECWDRIHPIIEEPEDLESRGGPFNWLADAESGAWFPSSIGKVPLMRIGDQVACLADCQAGQLAGNTLTTEAIKAGEPATATTVEDIAECLKGLQNIDQALTEKMADQAPSLASLREVLSACQKYLGFLGSPNAEENQQSAPEGQNGSEGGQSQRSSGGTSRADTYRQLSQLADNLARMEPHSPIPDLLRWAVKLGNMPFRQLIQELVQEPGALADIRRQMGIRESEDAGASPQ